MYTTLLALSSIGAAMASTKVVTRTKRSVCTTAGGSGTSTVMTAIKTGCSDFGFVDCTAGTYTDNSTDGSMSCPFKTGTTYLTNGTCYYGMNTTYACADIDGTKAADVTLYEGNNCNGSSLALGIFTKDVCTWVSSNNYGKFYSNATGSYVATYSAAECASGAQTGIVALAVTGLTGCATGSLVSGYQTAKWQVLETPAPTSATSAPTANNTTPTKSSGSMAAASLASAVIAAASLML